MRIVTEYVLRTEHSESVGRLVHKFGNKLAWWPCQNCSITYDVEMLKAIIDSIEITEAAVEKDKGTGFYPIEIVFPGEDKE